MKNPSKNSKYRIALYRTGREFKLKKTNFERRLETTFYT